VKKFMNSVDDILVESLTGFGKAHGDLVEISYDPTYVRRKAPTPAGKVV
jgi:dihydroxyacetone kinase-like protein